MLFTLRVIVPVKNNDDIKLLLESYRNTVELNTLLLERLGTLTDIHNEIRSKAEDRHVCLLQRILEVKDRMVSSFAGLKV